MDNNDYQSLSPPKYCNVGSSTVAPSSALLMVGGEGHYEMVNISVCKHNLIVTTNIAELGRTCNSY